MNKPDLIMVFAYVKNLWPRQFEIPNDKAKLDMMCAVWMDVLGDLDVESVRAGIIEMSTDQWPPSPGQIRSAVFKPVTDRLPQWDEYWRWVVERAGEASKFLLDDRPELRCPWPELDGVVTLRDLSDWARDGLTVHDLEMIQQAHVRRRFEPAVLRAQRTVVPDAPALEAHKKRTLDALEAAQYPAVAALRAGAPFVGVGAPDGRS